MPHDYGPRHQRCRVSLLVSGNGHSNMSDLLALTLQDFGSQVQLLAQPTAQQLDEALQQLMAYAAAEPWAEEASFSFTGSGVTWTQQGQTPAEGSGEQQDARPQELLLLEVAAAAAPAPAAGPEAASSEAAAGQAGGAGTASGLVAPLEGLQAQAEAAQLPLLIHIDAVAPGGRGDGDGGSSSSSSLGPSEEQKAAFARSLNDRLSFSHRVVTLAGAGADGTMMAWAWLLYKHTFLRSHPSWAAAQAAAAAELADAGLAPEELPATTTAGGAAALLPHGYVPEQHHRVLKLLADIVAAAQAAPRARRTARLLRQLGLLLQDGTGWRPFVLTWGLLLLHAAAPEPSTASTANGHTTVAGTSDGAAGATPVPGGGGGSGSSGAAAAGGNDGTALDACMRDLADLFGPEVVLPGALLALAASGSAEVAAAAAGVMHQLAPLTDYGRLPGEGPGQPDLPEARSQLGRQLLEVTVPPEAPPASASPSAAAAAAAAAPSRAGGPTGSAAPPPSLSRPLWSLPFVSGFLEVAGLGAELQQRRAAAGPEADWGQPAQPEAPLACDTGSGRGGSAAKRLRSELAGDDVDMQDASMDGSGSAGAAAPRPLEQVLSELLQHIDVVDSSGGGDGAGAGPTAGGAGGLGFPLAGASAGLMGMLGAGQGGSLGLPGSFLGAAAAAAALGRPPFVPPPSVARPPLSPSALRPLGQASSSQLAGTPRFGGTVGISSEPLPAGAEELTVRDIARVAPLLALTSLRRLTVSSASTPASQLCHLTALASLTHVELHYSVPNEAADAAPAWGDIPLKSLSLGCNSKKKYQVINTMSVMSGLAACTGLSSLHLCKMAKLSLHALAQTLSRLVQLADLQMSFMQLDDSRSQVSGWLQVMRVLVRLPSLKSLNLTGNAGVGEVAGELGACCSTRLTALKLSSIGLQDGAATRVVTGPNLRSLRVLHLSTTGATCWYLGGVSNDISDATMAVIAGHLTNLSELQVNGNKRLTQAGRQLVVAAIPGIRVVGP